MIRKLLTILFVLAFARFSIAAEPRMRAHFIDVGQGACTLLEFPCGAVLIDTGGQDDEHVLHLGQFLTDFFSRRPDLHSTLNAVIISHPHIDHTRGIEAVFGNFRVANYIDDGLVRGSGRKGVKFVRDHQNEHMAFIREIDDEEIVALPERTGLHDDHIDSIFCQDCDPVIRVLSGGLKVNPGWADRDFDNLNNHSVVVRVDFGDSSFLFTGDLETPALETLVDFYDGTDLLDVDVYLVGHHGSNNGTIRSLVDAMTPDVAVIGVGRSTFGAGERRGFNTFSYGHPRRSVIEMLSDAIPGRRSRPIDVDVADGAADFSGFHVTKRIYATAWDGDVTISAKLDGSMRVTTGITDDSPVVADAAPAGVAASPAAAPAAAPAEPAPVPVADQLRYQWNLPVPEKRPDSGGNGKLVLFDVSHGGTAGQSDWVIDGAFSDFADALVQAGYTVREYRGVDKNGDGAIRFFDDRRFELSSQNEATIEFGAIQEASVFIMAETNRPLRKDERAALEQFVESGKGLFLIADHYNADRNLNSWDATEVFNGYNRSTSPQFDLGGLYGDLRNPGGASQGWLAETFGLRFRFNAVDCHSGATEVVAPDEAEQLTANVQPVLMAAGSTLAIVDPGKAKGIIYFASTDPVRGWNKAVEGGSGGLYFGGRDEGPYVAISKPNAGKAAFIGDSSPIEDKSARYRNELSGSLKNLHNGWNDSGSAATLCVNIVNWLAKPEGYVGFDGTNGHAAGVVTPVPMAPVEQDDPDDGQPWGNRPQGYDPWDTDTFSPGSYGAPLPFRGGGGGGGGGGTLPTSLTVSQALNMDDGTAVVIEGIIQGEHNDQYGLRLADDIGALQFLSVQLPKKFRSAFSPHLKPSVVGTKIRISGTRHPYTGLPGLKGVTSIDVIDGM